MRYNTILLTLLLGCLSFLAIAQPINDECDNAILISNPIDWCSPIGAYNNTAATPTNWVGGGSGAACFSGNHKDVWFKFVAKATDVVVVIKGATATAAGGTLRSPEGQIYAGDCNDFKSLVPSCSSDRNGNNIIEMYFGGLLVGSTYRIRVQGRNGNVGSFQLCIKNYNPPKNPSSDCPTASILCNKDPFVVKSVTGAGQNGRELQDAECFANGTPGNFESNSTWFTWTADQSGPLTFDLKPLNTGDDLDFVVYELPRGVGNCSDKRILRCMASGDSDYPSPCMGPTGLNETSTDSSEDAGCETRGKDNYVRALDMVSGRSYALVINNFTSTGNGFSINFGGSGTFLGPKADFEFDVKDSKTCIGQEVTFTDKSTFALGKITKWDWNFGEGATPATATGQGPHKVKYTTVGMKGVTLKIESDKGCTVTNTSSTLDVDNCCKTFNAMTVGTEVKNEICAAVREPGEIKVSVTTAANPLTYLWNTGQTTSTLTNIKAGTYTVTITNAAKCDTILNVDVKLSSKIKIDTLLTRPDCDGGSNGKITLNPSGGAPPYQFNWGTGFSTENSLSNLKEGTYKVTVQDANACESALSITLNELKLELDPLVQAKKDPDCFGGTDGFVQVVITNGAAPYQYNFGNGFGNDNELNNLAAGTYRVVAQDANRCKGQFEFILKEPPALNLDITPVNISCFGKDDGKAIPTVSGGNGSYTFKWSDNQTDSIAIGLKSGIYTLTVMDKKQCSINKTVSITEPPSLNLTLVSVENVLCYGEQTGKINIIGSGGRPPFEYTYDNKPFRSDTTFRGLRAGNYVVTVKDTSGCTNSIQVNITQPDQFFIDAGQDQSVNLGDPANLLATLSPPTKIATVVWSKDSTLSCLTCLNPIANTPQSTIYSVTATDENGCQAVDRVNVRIIKLRPIYIPNAFSPNGDGNNDIFTVYGKQNIIKSVRFLRIYNRWGGLVYEGNNIPVNDETLGWDGTFNGKLLNPDVFVYYTDIEFIDGEVLSFKGDVNLIK